MSNKNLAVIPARGGSTRLPNKNLYILGGKPLICWIVDAVVRSERFDTIVMYGMAGVVLIVLLGITTLILLGTTGKI